MAGAPGKSMDSWEPLRLQCFIARWRFQRRFSENEVPRSRETWPHLHQRKRERRTSTGQASIGRRNAKAPARSVGRLIETGAAAFKVG